MTQTHCIDTPYTGDFFASRDPGSVSSAVRILPILIDLCHPTSIVDFGCGHGAWLSVARTLGIHSLRGFDGPWIEQSVLAARGVEFTPVDIGSPFEAGGPFDLAICLEVAEHIPDPQGRILIGNLCRTSDVVLFSAAVAGQGGLHHVNERPQSYWASIFKDHGFDAFDIIRPRIWHAPDVEFWYKQNMLLYSRMGSSRLDRNRLVSMQEPIFDLVHPEAFKRVVQSSFQAHEKLLAWQRSKLPPAVREFIRRRLGEKMFSRLKQVSPGRDSGP